VYKKKKNFQGVTTVCHSGRKKFDQKREMGLFGSETGYGRPAVFGLLAKKRSLCGYSPGDFE